MILSQKGKEILKRFEGFKSCPYRDQIGKPTVGIGTTIYPDGKVVTMKDPCINVDKAYEYLSDHVQKRVISSIEPSITQVLNQNQIDSIISLVYNIGAGRFLKSTLLKRININPNDKDGITEAFMMWVNAGGEPILAPRRRAEVRLYFS